jgi:hypothetical protein
MRCIPLILASALTTWLFALPPVSGGVSVYRGSLVGIQTAANEREGVKLSLNAEGDLPGMSSVSLLRDGNKVTGGEWTLTVLPPDADPTASERGKLKGTVAGGAVGFNDDGALTRVEGLQLTVQSGTGHYASVKRGSGTIDLAPHAENPSQLAGTLTLNF